MMRALLLSRGPLNFLKPVPLYRFSSNDSKSDIVPTEQSSKAPSTQQKASQGPRRKYSINAETKKSLFPRFDELVDSDLMLHTKYSFNMQIYSQFRWTPLIQYKDFSPEFDLKMRDFASVPTWSEDLTGELIDAQIYEALKNTGYEYYYDYECLPSKKTPFHGKVDFLIYNNNPDSKNHLPIVPVIKTKKEFNHRYKVNYYDFNVAEIVGVGL
jgi:hypothetical protein